MSSQRSIPCRMRRRCSKLCDLESAPRIKGLGQYAQAEKREKTLIFSLSR